MKIAVKKLVICALLIALYAVLDYVATLQISVISHASIKFVAVAMIGYLMGAGWGGICAGVCDILLFALNPKGGFLVGLTCTAVLTGLVYGTFLHGAKNLKKSLLIRVILAQIIVTFVINMVLNTWVLLPFYGGTLWAAFLLRYIKELVMFPVMVVLVYVMCGAVGKITRRR